MSNNPSNQRGGRRPASPSSLSLGQVGRDEAPLLLPITPNSSIDEINRLVQQAGAAQIELLVPDNTSALQSIAGNEALREAAKAAGVRVTIFTADEKTTHAARFAKLDVVSVGGAVAAPRPGDAARRPTGQRPALRPAANAPTAQPGPAQPTAQPRSAQPTAASQPRQPNARPTPAPQAAAPDADDEFLSRLNAFDEATVDEPPRARTSDEGALLFDVPGDIGVPRPSQNDDEWETFGQTRPASDEQAPPRRTSTQRRLQPIEQQRAPRPSLLSALLGFLPQRRRAVAADADRALPGDDDGLRMARPDRTPEELAARQRQSRSLLLWPLALIVALLGIVLIVAVRSDLLPGVSRLVSGVLPGSAPTLTITPPRSTAEAQDFTGLSVPMVSEPVTNADSINVQGVLLTAPVEVTLQGTASQTALSPIGYAEGAILIRNRSSQPVTIPAGALAQGGGQQFAFVETVTVPARVDTEDGTTFGAAQATLRATVPGAQGNIGPGSITQLADYGDNLPVRQDAPFSGGTDQEVPIVSPDDVSALLPQALSQLYGQGVTSIQNQTSQLSGFSLIQSQSTPEISPTVQMLNQIPLEELEVFPPIGQVIDPSLNGRFTLRIAKTFEALASPNDRPIEQQMQRAVANLLRRQGQNVTDDEVSISGWQRSSTGLLVDARLTPRGGFLPVSDQQQAEIAQALRGRSRVEAEQYLADLKQRSVIGDFTLPADLETMPDNLAVAVNAPEPQPSAP